MARLRAAVILALSGVAGATSAKATATPVGKVLELLGGLLEKGRAEKEQEAVKFAAFSQWCDGQVRVKSNEIAVAEGKIEKLKATIEKNAVSISQLTARIQELDQDVSRWEKDAKAAREVRDRESEDYRTTSQDYTESMQAIAGAIEVLKKNAGSRPQVLLQVRSMRHLPDAAREALSAYIQDSSEGSEAQPEMLLRSAPQAAGYETQSGGILDLLANLKKEFADKKYNLDAEELSAQHAFEQVFQQLSDLLEAAKHEIAKKTAARAEAEQAKADAEGTLAQVTEDKAEDKRYLDETNALCTVKRNDFANRQSLREEELVALGKAKEIIESPDVAGAGSKHLPSLAQAASFVQLRAGAKYPEAQARIAMLLAHAADRWQSRPLSLLAEQIANGPFDKIKKMVQDMIFKLREEATAEAEKHGWCQAELAANKVTRESKTEAVNKLAAEVDGLTASIAALARDIKALTAAVAELDAAVQQATAERAASKAKNDETVAEAKAAQTAVKRAIAVLQDFYAKSAQATSFAQSAGPADDAPETFDAPYTGMSEGGGGVVDFLEVILSDFSRLESDTTAAEAAEAKEHKNFLFESEKDMALKNNEKGHKQQSKTDKESTLHSAQLELKAVQEELNVATAYFEKLKPTCSDSGPSYEETVRKREAEMQSLNEALTILKNM